MFRALKESMLRGDAVAVAGGLVVALATFTLMAVVAYLIAPLISIFVGSTDFETNAFTIDGSEFRYGVVIEAAIILALALAAVYFLVASSFPRREGELAARNRACPQCTLPISVDAKRCPHCTAVLQSDLANE